MTARVFGKTELGINALTSTRGALSSPARQLLILIDGQRSHGELAAIFGAETVDKMLPVLETQGYVRLLAEAIAPPATAPQTFSATLGPATVMGRSLAPPTLGPATVMGRSPPPPTLGPATIMRRSPAPTTLGNAGGPRNPPGGVPAVVPPPTMNGAAVPAKQGNALLLGVLIVVVLGVAAGLWSFLASQRVTVLTPARATAAPPPIAAEDPPSSPVLAAPATASNAPIATAAPAAAPTAGVGAPARSREETRTIARFASDAANRPAVVAPTAPVAAVRNATARSVPAPAIAPPAPPALAPVPAPVPATSPGVPIVAAPPSINAPPPPITPAASAANPAPPAAPAARNAASEAAPVALRVRDRVMPEISRRARRNDITTGVLVVRMHVDPNGKVANVEVVRAEPPQIYDTEMERTLRRWTFDPPGQAAEATFKFDFKP